MPSLQYSFIPDAGERLEARKGGYWPIHYMRCFLRLLCTGLVSLLQGPDRPICAQFALEVLNSYRLCAVQRVRPLCELFTA